MNAKARKKEKAHNPAGKVTRQELDKLCERLSKDFLVVYWVFDLIIEKGVFTAEELAAFIAKRVAEANNPVPRDLCDEYPGEVHEVYPCEPATTSEPSSTLITQ